MRVRSRYKGDGHRRCWPPAGAAQPRQHLLPQLHPPGYAPVRCLVRLLSLARSLSLFVPYPHFPIIVHVRSAARSARAAASAGEAAARERRGPAQLPGRFPEGTVRADEQLSKDHRPSHLRPGKSRPYPILTYLPCARPSLTLSQLFRSVFPQFAQQASNGAYKQQDADEALTTILTTVNQKLPRSEDKVRQQQLSHL